MPSSLLDPTSSQKERFRTMAVALCERFRALGVTALPWDDPELPHFARLNDLQRRTILQSLEAQLYVLDHAPAGAPLDSWSFLRAFLQRMNLQLSPDLERFAAPDDYIAVYDRFQGILFFSPNHFRYLSYPLEDLFCRLWITIFRRDHEIEKELLSRVYPFALGERRETLSNADIPPHVISEVKGPGMRSVAVESKAYSPLFQDGEPCGFVVLNHRVKPLS